MQYVRDLFSVGKGVLRQAADRAFAPGQWAALPTADIDFRGALARTEGGTGVNDALRFAEKDTADTYRWALVPTLPTDPGADRIAFWDDSDNAFRYLTVSTGLSLSGTTLTSTGLGTFITSAAPSGETEKSINGCFTATYESYLVRFRLTLSANAQLSMRLRAAGTDESGANTYYSSVSRTAIAISNVADGTTGRTQMVLLTAPGTTNAEAAGTLVVDSPFATAKTLVQGDVTAATTTPAALREVGGSGRNATTSYDGFTILVASGTMTGTIRVYGIVNA